MRKNGKKIAIITTTFILIVATMATLSTKFIKNVDSSKTNLSQENLRAMNYAELTDGYDSVEGTDNVKFSSFFTRDLNDDGNAEKLEGTCKNVNAKDTLYIDLNVSNEGHLKNGKIEINGTNFNYSMGMVKDETLKDNYISDDVKVIELNDIQAGTEKLILGNIISNINNDTKNYSKVSTITLTGTYVSDNGTEIEINKTVDLTVDWYGNVNTYLYTYNSTYNYDNSSENTVSFYFYTKETCEELILKDVIGTAVIPELNGYAPTNVVCQDGNVENDYNEETRTITITRSSKVDENGVLEQSISRTNTFRINVTYPEEAFKEITDYTELTIPITAKYVAYNNENEEFENPISSNIASENSLIIFAEAPAYAYKFDVKLADKRYVTKPYYRYIISKQNLLSLYDNEEYNGNFEYTVNWYASRGNTGEIESFIMSETKLSEEGYGDKFDQIIMEEYTTNKGIYFLSAEKSLGENGTISVYNNDTNELIKTFTKEDFNTYNSKNPYKYEEVIKHIRVETSKPNSETTLIVCNLKELDGNKIVKNFTKEQIENVKMVYTYLTGVADVKDSGKQTQRDLDYAYYVSEKSYAEIELETDKISTQETTNEKIYISATAKQSCDAKWKNGEFLVEIPEDIVNMEINSVTTNKPDVEIIAYDLYKKDGKYFIKVITENETQTTYTITVDVNLTPDSRKPSSNKQVKVYTYNEYCNNYYYQSKDIYDVNGNNNTEENVGIASVDLNLIAPTAVITFETVSDYNEEKEITVAPNIAEVKREERTAKINIHLSNNYPNTVSGIKILGKIPYEGNTYITNGKDLHSEFNTIMGDTGIHISDSNPEEVKEKTLIYYSENENATIDLENEANGWMLLEDVKDFSKIKTYLIDMKNYAIKIGEEIKFDYDINIPENVKYNLSAFSTHAIYYSLNTEGGNLSLGTEPNKVGVKITKKFDLELTKYKVCSNIKIPGVIYALKYKEQDLEGKVQNKSRILTTDSEGKAVLKDLYAETEYILQEIKVPNTCELDTREIKFKVNEDLSITFNGDVRKYEFATNGEMLKIELEDEVKYSVEINAKKVDTNIPINNIKFLIVDENEKSVSKKTQNGVAIFEGLSLNKEYTISEINVPENCELNEGIFKFKIIRNSNNQLEIVTIENSLGYGEPTVQELEGVLTPVLNLNVQNELRYSLNLTKQDLEGNKINGVYFTIKGKGFSSEETKFVTVNDGKIFIPGLYVGENYTLEEIKASGYYLDSEKENNIKFRVDRISGSLQIIAWEKGNGILQVGSQTINEQNTEATVEAIIENEKIPTYGLKILTQNDKGESLPGVQFKLTSIDTGVEETITINKNGVGNFENLYEFIEAKCITGEYTLQEIYAPEGYVVNKNVLKFKASRDENGKVVFIILDGEDLIKTNSQTNEKVISTDENIATITIVNKPIFSIKKYGDGNILLPNAKFIVTDLNGNYVTDVNGNTVGIDETIDGTVYKVVTTNEKGEISINLPEGLYKAVEVEAPVSYELPEKEENRTYYFGIGESRPETTTDKMDSIKWANSIKSKQTSKFSDALVAEDGGVIAVGTTSESIDINGDGIPDTEGQGAKDAVIVKYDVDGNIVWSKILGGTNNDVFNKIEKDPTGGYVIVGYSDSLEVYYNGALTNVSNRGNEDGIIVKIDENGNYLWSKTIGGTGKDIINDVAVNENGDIAVVGSYYSPILHIADEQGYPGLTNLGNKDGFVAVYINDGSIMWAQNIGGPNDVYAKAVTWTSSGNVVVGANFYGTVYVNTEKTKMFKNNNNVVSLDGLLAIYNYSGTYMNGKQIGGTGSDAIYDIILADSNDQVGVKNIIVAGSYSSTNLSIDGNALTTRGRNDGMILKFTETGTCIKAISIGGTYDDTVSTIVQTEDGGLLYGGWSYSRTVDLDGNKTYDLSNVGTQTSCSGFISKLNTQDKLEWSDGIYGASCDEVTKVLEAKDGSYIAIGDYKSESLRAMKKVILKNNNFPDAFIIKYGAKILEATIPELQEVSVKNKLEEFKITTEIAKNINGERIGGTITGEYSDSYLEKDNIKFVESVKYGYSNEKNIEIKPNTDYSISKITINDEIVEIEANEDGSITIPAGYFKNITENKHIVVYFANKGHSITIKKQDEEGNSISGATFEITTNNDTPEFGEIVANGATYTRRDESTKVVTNGNLVQNGRTYQTADKTKEVPLEVNLTKNGKTYAKVDTSKEVSETLGELTSNGEYYFEQSDGKYISNNNGKNNTVASSYIEIDLSNKEGLYAVIANAQISSERVKDFGYAHILEKTSDDMVAPEYDDTNGQFIKTSGTGDEAKDYTSEVLEGGKVYRLYFGYIKDSSVGDGDDVFTINSVNIYEADYTSYYFEEQNGAYVANNTSQIDTVASSYIQVDLTNKTGKYAIVINAEKTGDNYSSFYATITENQTVPEYVANSALINKEIAHDYTLTVEAGKMYYLHLTFNKRDISATAKVNSIKMYEAKDVTYYFEEVEDGKYIPNNMLEPKTLATSYLPIDLTGKTGKYEIVVNAEENSSSGSLYAILTEDTDIPEFNSPNKFMSLYANSSAKDYTITIDAGKMYYLHLCFNNGADFPDSVVINSIKMYELKDHTFYFEKTEDGKYVSNNQGIYSTVAKSYIPLDLSNYSGYYKLTVNAEISSETGDNGYIYATTEEKPTSPDGRMMYESGDVPAKDYTRVLTGGNFYYIHFGYSKNASDSSDSDSDTFTINSISIEPIIKTYTVTTDITGKAMLEVDYGKYTIKEIEAPEHYILSDEITEVELLPSDIDKTVTIINKKMPRVIVHHYLKDGDEYTKDELADDEILEDLPGKSYTTSPKMNLENYTLEKDENGEYVVPELASGTFADRDIEITYYYEENKVKLTVHHYLEGTENKIVDDIVESYKKQDTYKTEADSEILKDYELVLVDGTEEGTITEDTVVTYYYKKKVHNITTSVKPHTEVRTDPVSNEKFELEALGGTITGEYNEEFKEEDKIQFVEAVKQKEDSNVNITITPDLGYRVKEIILESMSDEGNKETTTLYSRNITVAEETTSKENEEEAKQADITEDEENGSGTSIKENEDGTFSLSKFTNVQENKHITVEFEPVQSTVIIHHILKDKMQDYKTETKEDFAGEYYVSKEIEIPGYKFVESSNNTNGKFEENTIDVYYYYEKTNISYSIHYFYDGVENISKQENSEALFESTVTTYVEKGIVGYKLEKTENLPLTIAADAKNNVINIYYVKDNFEYTVHYFYDGVEDESKKEIASAKYESTVENYTDKAITGYKLEKTENLPLTITENAENNKINVYYTKKNDLSYTVNYLEKGTNTVLHTPKTVDKQVFGNVIVSSDEIIAIDGYVYDSVNKDSITISVSDNIINIYYLKQYKITTNVIEHTEIYKDGTVVKAIKGGTISGEGALAHELVTKGGNSTKAIVISPDEGYEIVKVTINDLELQNIEDKISKDGNLSLATGYFNNVQENKEVKVEFRKKTKVIVQYLEENTNKVLAEQEEYLGYEGKSFETSIKAVANYKASELGITDENSKEVEASGTMFADEITIIYWYAKIPSGVVERHIEINEKGGTNEIESSEIKGYASEEITTNRKKYDGYISVDGPKNDNVNIIVTKKDENKKTVTLKESGVVEVWYYYEKEHQILTEVKAHNEKDSNGTVISVEGGTISKEYETDSDGNTKEVVFETVLHRGDNAKEIVITPDYGYQIKEVTINDEPISIEKLIGKDGKIILPAKYFTDVQENKNIVVEFEKEPAKVIVKYIDIDTKEEVASEKEVNGYVKSTYSEERAKVESYIPAGEEPSNKQGEMTKEPITVIFYYTKQFKITTAVKEHEEELEDGKKVPVKGGNILGEDELLYEYVLRGKTSTKQIIMKPEYGYVVKEVIINGKPIEVKNYIKADGSLELPLFENVQEDKHIEVEYAKNTDNKTDEENKDNTSDKTDEEDKDNINNKTDKEDKNNTSNKTEKENNKDNATNEGNKQQQNNVKLPQTGQSNTVYIVLFVTIGLNLVVSIWEKKSKH